MSEARQDGGPQLDPGSLGGAAWFQLLVIQQLIAAEFLSALIGFSVYTCSRNVVLEFIFSSQSPDDQTERSVFQNEMPTRPPSFLER